MARGANAAGAGTMFLKATAQTYGDLIADNGSTTTSTAPFTPVPATGAGSITFDHLTVTGGAKLSIADPVTVTSGSPSVDSFSRLQAPNLPPPPP